MWPEEFNRLGEKVETESLRFLRGRVEKRGREPNVVVDAMWTLEEAEREFTSQVFIKFQKGLHDERSVTHVRDLLAQYPGKVDVVVVVDTVDEANGDSRVRFISQKPLASKVTCSKEFRRDLARVLGSGNIKCVAEVKRGARPSASIGR
jgi:DNA polymerase-3 subunit alpha